jgi:hypothetical protein
MHSTNQFLTGEVAPETAIYRVSHADGRPPFEVILLRGELFPKCAACGDQLTFELIRGLRGRHVNDYRLKAR